MAFRRRDGSRQRRRASYSVVHSMVEFVDGSIIARLSTPDMCLPIQYALTYPDRARSERVQTNFLELGSLTFEEPDTERFPAALARRAGEVGGTLPAVLSSEQIAVDAFCAGKINFPQITETVARTMDAQGERASHAQGNPRSRRVGAPGSGALVRPAANGYANDSFVVGASSSQLRGGLLFTAATSLMEIWLP